MFREEKNKSEIAGKRTGYAFGYFLFTTVLFVVLAMLGKIPAGWGYFHIMAVTLAISLTGTFLKGALK